MLVSAIMPTRGRPEFARMAIDCFRWQTWPWKELVIVDDLACRSVAEPQSIIVSTVWPPPPTPMIPPEGIVRYQLCERRLAIGAKRNLACKIARGEIIVHWDDDDWSAPGRIEDQVTRLLATGKAVTGYHSMRFLDHAGEWWQYSNPNTAYALGTSLCYRRSWWERNPFPERVRTRDGYGDVTVGEDTSFTFHAQALGQIVSVDAGELMFARIHDGNTSPRQTNSTQWSKICAPAD